MSISMADLARLVELERQVEALHVKFAEVLESLGEMQIELQRRRGGRPRKVINGQAEQRH